MLLVGAIIGFFTADFVKAKEPNQKRLDFYETYYKNLSPSKFKGKKNGKKIEIEIR